VAACYDFVPFERVRMKNNGFGRTGLKLYEFAATFDLIGP
jgi:hypothetical protein